MTSYLSLLQNKYLINNYVSLLNSCSDKIIKTRSIKIRATASCRLWQLQYCILFLIYKNLNFNLRVLYSKLNDGNFIYKLCQKYTDFLNNIQSNQSNQSISVLYNLLIMNNLNTNGLNISSYKYHNFENIFGNNLNKVNKINTVKNYYCCLYLSNLSNGNIVHYFTIIQIKNSTNPSIFDYYITSSYGSDYVCVPYQIEKLDNLMDFYKFCYALNNLKSNESNQKEIIDYFIKFMTKYFLKGLLPKRYDEDTIEDNPKLFSKWIKTNEGLNKELNYYLKNENEFDVAIINNYEELVNQTIIQ